MTLPILTAVLFGSLLVAAALLAVRWLLLRARTQQRWYELTEQARAAARQAPPGVSELVVGSHALARWLYRAGFRQPQAVPVFLASTLAGSVLGLSAATAFVLSGTQHMMEQLLILIPGGVGETFLPFVWIAPWLVMLTLAGGPWIVVQRARRQRVELVEQDLPLALELLSTLSEAGLGFDTALTRILKTRLAGRPLAEDFRMFQADLLAGRPRTESLRRLSQRLDTPSVSVFVSALVQAEQLGMGIARVLRQQADDVRARRRERALTFANALPVKRVIPLVVCFLPGLFVWTLGPAFVQLFRMADAFLQMQNF